MLTVWTILIHSRPFRSLHLVMLTLVMLLVADDDDDDDGDDDANLKAELRLLTLRY